MRYGSNKERARLLREKGVWERRARDKKEPLQIAGYAKGNTTLSSSTIDVMGQTIVKRLALKPSERVLEVGCGNGLFLSRIKGVGVSIAGIDFSFSMLSRAQETCRRDIFINAEAAQIPFKDDSFDKVYCIGVFHHFPSLQYARRVIEEMVRVLKPGGNIFIGSIPRPDEAVIHEHFLWSPQRGVLKNAFMLIKWYGARKLGRRSQFIYYPQSFFKEILSDFSFAIENQREGSYEAFPRYNVVITNIKKYDYV